MSAVRHWTAQRATALALIPLASWLLVSLLLLPDLSWASVTGWLGGAWQPVAMILTILCVAWHSQLGVQVVIEDYVHHAGFKPAALMLSAGLHAVLALSGVVAVPRIARAGTP